MLWLHRSWRELEAALVLITDESQFQALIEDAEEAISREHTLWYIRRNLAAMPR